MGFLHWRGAYLGFGLGEKGSLRVLAANTS